MIFYAVPLSTLIIGGSLFLFCVIYRIATRKSKYDSKKNNEVVIDNEKLVKGGVKNETS